MANEPQPDQENISLYEKLFFNIIIFGILYASFSSSKKPIEWSPCTLETASTASTAMIVLVMIHLTFHTFGPLIAGIKVNIGPVELDGKSLMQLLARISLWKKPEYFSWTAATLIILICVYLGFLSQSPFVIENPSPGIIDFTVQYQDGKTIIIQAGRTIEISTEEIIIVTANVPENAKITCDWMVITGSLGDAEGCKTRYRPPQGKNQDSIMVSAETTCSSETAYQGLYINISP